MRKVAAGAFALCVAAACEARPDGDGEGQEWEAVELLRLGALDGPESFGRVDGLDWGPAGRIRVLDAISGQVLEFDSAGRQLRSFGRVGEGPGEFGGPNAIVSVADSLVVQDVRYHKYVVFDSAGQFVRNVDRRVPGIVISGQLVDLGAGRILDFYPDLPGADDASPNLAMVPVEVDLNTGAARELPEIEGVPFHIGPWSDYHPQDVLTADADGSIWHGFTHSPFVLRRAFDEPDSDTVLRISMPPKRMESSARQRILADLREQARGRPVDPGLLPRDLPLLRKIWPLGDGVVGIVRMREPYSDETGTRVDIYRGNRFMDSVRLELSTRAHRIRERRILGRSSDAAGIPYVTVVELRQRDPGG